jgi:thiol:disulfide interchange protein DsbD
MVDLYADWCVACEELATRTLPDPRVRKALANTLWLQMDLSDSNNPETIRILKHFRVPGLPSVMFFDLNGVERTRYRVTGFLSPEDFVARVQAAFGKTATP